MARETWIAPNHRIIGLALMLPATLFLAGTVTYITSGTRSWQSTAGILMMAVSAALIALLVRAQLRPRVAYRTGRVEFYLRGGQPLAVPIEHVEAFFLGQDSTSLSDKLKVPMETMTLVARLSRRAEEWSHVAVKPALGRWCDGYVTIRGMWCEPLTPQLIEWLNRRLYEVKQEPQRSDQE
jgi:hypothetical protein